MTISKVLKYCNKGIILFQVFVFMFVLYWTQTKDEETIVKTYQKQNILDARLAYQTISHICEEYNKLNDTTRNFKLTESVKITPTTDENHDEQDNKPVSKPLCSSVKCIEQRTLIQKREKSIQQKCETYASSDYWKQMHPTGTIWTPNGTKLNYCITPKVGCTYWKREMRFLSKDYPSNMKVERPSDINRYFVHYGSVKNITVTDINNPLSRISLSTGRTFMFARDPWSRLWSGYIDKLFLPDFWVSVAPHVAKTVRPPLQEKQTCINNITFEEFLVYINKTNPNLNEHWRPVHKICSPCHVNFEVVGKMESFAADSDYIHENYGIDKFEEIKTVSEAFYEEVKMLTEYNFNLGACTSNNRAKRLIIAIRLWKAFQLNGYINRNTNFPSEKFDEASLEKKSPEVFLELFNITINQSSYEKFDKKKQKRDMMIEAYRSIPMNTLANIQRIYKYDFELFEYEIKPSEIFGGEYQQTKAK